MKNIRIESAIVSFAEDWDTGVHDHESSEISVVLEGSGWFECGGRHHLLEAGHVILTAPSLPHRFQTVTPIRLGVLQIYHIPQKSTQFFYQLLPLESASVLSFSALALEQYESLFRHWLHGISQPLIDSDQYRRSWIEILLAFIQHHAKPYVDALSVAAVEEYIRAHLQTKILIGNLAKMVNLSKSSFCILFKKTYGMTPKKYQMQCRMSEAKRLLRSSDKSIQYIAEKIGFSNQNAFSAWFQECENISPSSWRKAQQGLYHHGELLSDK